MTVEAAARGVGMVPAFQPIVSLSDETVVGFEAVARWPDFAGLGADAVFAHAREHGHLDQLDQACIEISVDQALRSTLPEGTLLSVNCEPASAYRPLTLVQRVPRRSITKIRVLPERRCPPPAGP
jgi:EAL domain-containing protein (putative c-di-GMP-specific phosphodiesterase class I)